MNTYLLLKWLHIVSSVVLVGLGAGSAFYGFFAARSRNTAAQAFVGRWVVRADWIFTTPTVILQPATGFAMLSIAGWPLSTSWIATSLALYVLAGACWLPVVWIQVRMARLAEAALAEGGSVPQSYYRMFAWWTALGCIAFSAMLAIFYLMVVKP